MLQRMDTVLIHDRLAVITTCLGYGIVSTADRRRRIVGKRNAAVMGSSEIVVGGGSVRELIVIVVLVPVVDPIPKGADQHQRENTKPDASQQLLSPVFFR